MPAPCSSGASTARSLCVWTCVDIRYRHPLAHVPCTIWESSPSSGQGLDWPASRWPRFMLNGQALGQGRSKGVPATYMHVRQTRRRRWPMPRSVCNVPLQHAVIHVVVRAVIHVVMPVPIPVGEHVVVHVVMAGCRTCRRTVSINRS